MRSKQKKEPIIFQNGDEACCDELTPIEARSKENDLSGPVDSCSGASYFSREDDHDFLVIMKT